MRGKVFAAIVVACTAVPGGAGSAEPSLRLVQLTGTRTVTVDGRPPHGIAAGTFAVSESDTGPGIRRIAFGAPRTPPDDGVQPSVETVDAALRFAATPGVARDPITVSVADTVRGLDAGAHQQFAVNEVWAVTTTSHGLAAVERVADHGNGTNGTTFADADFTRTTNADGSFHEDGSLGANETHALRVGADFGATSSDRTPGFSLREVTTSAPDGDTPDARIAVTVRSQGRTIGPTPIDEASFVVRRWFPQQARPTRVDHAVRANAPLPSTCGFAATARAPLAVHDRRRQIDPTGEVRDAEHDAFYDAAMAPLCRRDRIVTEAYDPTTGARTGARTDETVVSRAATSARTGTR